MRGTWTDLVIINGRARHPETQSHLIEDDDNHTLKMALDKWMQQHHHTDNWSKGIKYMFMLILHFIITFNKYSSPVKVWAQLFMQLIPTMLPKPQMKHLMKFFISKTDLYHILKYRKLSVNLV